MKNEMKKLSPNLMVKDVKETVDFYTNTLGFTLVMAVSTNQESIMNELPEGTEIVWALIKNGVVEIMLQNEATLHEDVPPLKNVKIGASCTFYIEVTDLDEMYKKVHKEAEVVKDIFTTWYGMKEFYIRDNNGYILCLAQSQEK